MEQLYPLMFCSKAWTAEIFVMFQDSRDASCVTLVMFLVLDSETRSGRRRMVLEVTFCCGRGECNAVFVPPKVRLLTGLI